MRAEELRRQELTEALVGLVRTAGTGSFPRITDKDRVFFRGLAVSGKADATEEQLAAARDEVLAMRKRMTAPKCVGCGGAPDLTGDFYLASVEDEDMEVRALKYVTLYTLRSLAPFVDRALSDGRTRLSWNGSTGRFSCSAQISRRMTLSRWSTVWTNSATLWRSFPKLYKYGKIPQEPLYPKAVPEVLFS